MPRRRIEDIPRRTTSQRYVNIEQMLPNLSRRRALLALGAVGVPPLLAPAIVPFHAWSQGLPDKPVSLLVGFAPGGGSDHLARVVAPRLESRIGRHVRVENHAGANGSLVGEALKKGRPGGTLLGCIASTTVNARVASASYPFDPVADMVPLSLGGLFPMALAISPETGVDSLTQFTEWLKGGDKARARVGASMSGAFLDFYIRLLGRELGAPLDPVAYRGDRPALNDVRDNKIPAAVASLPAALEFHRGGKVKIIVTSAETRLTFAPNLPSAFEYGRTGLITTEWYGLFASPGTPGPIVDLWNMHIRAVLEEQEAKAELTNVGLTVQASTPEELGNRVTSSLKLWRDKMLAFGLQPPG
jgi:tripartite-type tricarboxylate transporter receptor subunit TctC